MCGISGASTFKESGVPAGVVRRINDAVRHRGPDDEGFFRDARGHVELGHRRLSIIDLTTGHQPVFNEDGRVAIVFNGEIYNYQELRADLEQKGHRFVTHSDTETIVHLYEEYGDACLDRLRGMFAFAIWDGRRDELFIARDRVGKKPIYYAHVNGTLYFASEIQALFTVPEIPRDLDYDAIDLFLTYSCIPSPRSIYTGIHKLPPAHALRFSAAGVSTTRYWRPEYQPKLTIGYQEATEELRRLLTDAVRLRLISDVPLGAFLSGGVDSSAIVAIMSRLSDRPVKTFSIGFEDEGFNELPFAREVAAQYRTEHQEFMVAPDKLDVLAELVRHYGEPYGDSSAIPTWYLSRMTRTHVTVALNGDGGDELFGGYPWYRMIHTFNAAANPVVRAVARAGMVARAAMPRQARRALELLAMDRPHQFQSLRSYQNGRDRTALYHADFRARLRVNAEAYLCDLYDESLSSDYDASFKADFLSYLPEDLMVKVDRASMAHGLECRSPLLDQELVEFASRLPPEWKIASGRSKSILKDAVGAWFPAGFVDRRKMGFSVPVGRWFKGELKSFIHDRLMHGPLSRIPLVRADALAAILREHNDGVRDHETSIWNLLMLSLWFEEYGAQG